MRRADSALRLVQVSLLGLTLWAGCGPPQTYSRLGLDASVFMNGQDSGQPDGIAGRGGMSSTGTGGTFIGSGGTPSSSGGVGGGGTGGLIGTGPGGRASGGATSSGGVGGMGAGPAGGSPATGGMMAATGGAVAGGGAPAIGGRGGAATGGAATGGAATGGAATGGAGTGGAGIGGTGAGGSPPTRLILSIDFVGGRGTTAATAMAASETAGARPAAHWNSASGDMGSAGSLTLSDGTKSNASITWDAPVVNTTSLWTMNYADTPGDLRMMNGYLDPRWSTIPANASTLFTVSGLPAVIANGTYDVYVYTVGEVGSDMRSYQYTLGAQSETVKQETAPPVPPPSPYPYARANSSMVGTHVVFTATGSSFIVTAKPVSGAAGIYRAPVNGIQIVWPSGS
jgi:hypothetical protein